MVKPVLDLGQDFLKQHRSEGQIGRDNTPGQKNPRAFETDPRLMQKATGGPAAYNPGPNQALKNRRDTGMGRMGTDEYYENKDRRKGITSDEPEDK